MGRIELTPHVDGYQVLFDGQTVDVFPTWDAARAGMKAALDAIWMLSATLSRLEQKGAR